ncbi:MAG TPA: UDP-N-acetylmuramoyl-L-alanine--D-glutamate ligase, partial [Candidatus Paceibacterota bacterium]|nr:UDP-N-acetylmuramoyl-L-alanine--D-glutamate ligase [Candidatus Paceibacterota bacterium]
ITGTKGKGTTSTLLYEILKAAKWPVQLAGNIGKPALDILPKIKKDSWVILELSSFQLQDLQRSSHIAVVLDVFPDHQDAHRDLKEYFEAKAQIANHQKPGDKVFYFEENPKSVQVSQGGHGKKIPVRTVGFELFRPEDLAVRGEHNYRNAIMATTVAQALGVPEKTVLATAKKFTGLDHRLQLVRRLSLKAPGVKNAAISFWDDSASTNPHTSAAAIRSFPGANNILLAGGQDKNLDYAPLAEALSPAICQNNSTLVVLFGENRYKIKKALEKACVIIEMAPTLKSALDFAVHAAKSAKASTNIIFSPGAASFDMFQNYADRGDQFQRLVRALR